LTALGEVNGNPWTSVAELNVGVVPASGQTLAAAPAPRKPVGGAGSAGGQPPPRVPVRR
jgi:hypothetical protein